MKEKSRELQEANFKIATLLGFTWADACKLSQTDRAFLLEKATQAEGMMKEQQEAQEAAQREQQQAAEAEAPAENQE